MPPFGLGWVGLGWVGLGFRPYCGYEATIVVLSPPFGLQEPFCGRVVISNPLFLLFQIADSGQQEEASPTSSEPSSWTAGAHCRAIHAEDGLEYEATIDEVVKDESGNPYARVTFIGYGNEATAWLADLKPSQGEEARKKQLKDSGAEEEEEQVGVRVAM